MRAETWTAAQRLGNLRPADLDPAVLFTADMDTEITRLVVANLSAGAVAFRVWHVPFGVALDDAYALYYDGPLAAGGTASIEAATAGTGIQLKQGDTLHVRSSSANNIAFNVYGITTDVQGGL